KSGAEEKMKGFYDNEEAIKRIVDKSKSSIGSEIEKHDLDEIKLLAANAINLRGERRALTEYIEKGMAREMPNFSVLAGPVLGARLLSKAGGMKRLAFMPSSTIQVLGAEKALFQHLRTGAKGPKHGLLYSHALVRAAKPWNRGRIARTISGKLAIAARGDYFLKEKSSDLKETANLLEKRANELSERGKRHGVSSDKEKGHKKSKGKGRRAH
ncbi:MAG: C/D box methylation guide ribonucleoprotein complex aNOP56 subunit, partial [Candidatus Diapherotrites archaeon]